MPYTVIINENVITTGLRFNGGSINLFCTTHSGNGVVVPAIFNSLFRAPILIQIK